MPLLLIAFDLTTPSGFPHDVVAIAPDDQLEKLKLLAEEPWHREWPYSDDRPPAHYERCEIWLVDDNGVGLVLRRGPRWWVTARQVLDRDL